MAKIDAWTGPGLHVLSATNVGYGSPKKNRANKEEVIAIIHLLVEKGADVNSVNDREEVSMKLMQKML